MTKLPPRKSKQFVLALSVLAGFTLLTAAPLFADEPSGAGVAAAGAAFLFMLVIFAAIYVYFALALVTIAKKTNTENAWWGWVPILQIILMLNIAKKPVWWIILLLVPLVNLIIGIMVWMAVAEARGKPSWWGILLIVPVLGVIVPGYLAWSD